MKKKKTRKKFLKRFTAILFLFLIFVITGHLYMNRIEPSWIGTNRIDIQHPLIPQSFRNFKIVQFSDTHIGFQMDFKDLERVVNKISQENPDMIIFSGDLVDNLLTFFEYEEIILILASLEAPYGKYAVYGNHDHGGWGTEKYRHIMESAGFRVLRNEAVPIKNGNDDEILLAGVDDAMLGNPDLAKTLKDARDERFTILVSHAPDLADEAASLPVHFQISGHTHGGQIKLPLFGPLITPPYGEKYVEGLYSINGDFILYVNRGLGTTRLPYRLLSRPEITVYTLKNY